MNKINNQIDLFNQAEIKEENTMDNQQKEAQALIDKVQKMSASLKFKPGGTMHPDNNPHPDNLNTKYYFL
jgi:hypothetical protein